VRDRYPSLVPVLENLVPYPHQVKIGAKRAEMLRIVEEVGNCRLGLCWDMGHDVKAGRLTAPDAAWLDRVVHVHLHDIDENGTDHYPLLCGQVPYRTWLPALIQVGFKGIVTLEIKWQSKPLVGVRYRFDSCRELGIQMRSSTTSPSQRTWSRRTICPSYTAALPQARAVFGFLIHYPTRGLNKAKITGQG